MLFRQSADAVISLDFCLQLKAIVDLKERKTKGEVLEATQLKKIEGEGAILQELKTLENSIKK